MADAPAKAPRQLSPIDWDVTEFVRNPGGSILDIHKEHPAVPLAVGSKDGWRLATLKEAQDYCEKNFLDPKDLEGYAAHVKELQRNAERAQLTVVSEAASEEAPPSSDEAPPRTKK